MIAGILAGAVWNLANLWCLTQLLTAWLGSKRSNTRVIGWPHHLPQPPLAASSQQGRSAPAMRWQVVGWLLLKFPLLYLAAWLLLTRPFISLVGFGVGFTIVLVAVMAQYLLSAQREITRVSHDH